MAPHPAPLNAMLSCKLIETLPEIGVFHRLLVRGAPAFALPSVDPFGDSLLHILRVGIDDDRHGAFQTFERADYCGQLHTIVRGRRLATEQLLFLATVAQQGTPATRPGSAFAGTVGEDFHRSRGRDSRAGLGPAHFTIRKSADRVEC